MVRGSTTGCALVTQDRCHGMLAINYEAKPVVPMSRFWKHAQNGAISTISLVQTVCDHCDHIFVKARPVRG